MSAGPPSELPAALFWEDAAAGAGRYGHGASPFGSGAAWE